MEFKLQFDTHGNNKQKECARAWIDPNIKDIVYGGSKYSAKSYTGCSLIFGDAFMYPGTHYFIARKKLNDLRKHTRPSIQEVFNHWGLSEEYYKFNGMDNYYELYNGSKVFLLEGAYQPGDPEFARFGSIQMTRGWIEEAGEFEKLAKDMLEASVGRWKNDEYGINGKLLQTCNPSKNYLYKDYYKPFKGGTLDKQIRFIQALPSDNKKIQKGYLENLERILSGNARRQLLLGDWEYDDSPDSLCNYEDILSMFENDHIEPGTRKFITADIARLGSDKAIIAVWSGWVVIEWVIFEKSKLTQLQNTIIALRTKYGIAKQYCIADEDGVGGGVVDNCKIKGFVNNSKALKDENYANLQAQCCYNIAKRINSNGLWIKAEMSDKHQEELVEDFEQLKSYDTDKIGKNRIMPKEKVKELIGRSPDWRDVIMMREWFDLKPSGNYSWGTA